MNDIKLIGRSGRKKGAMLFAIDAGNTNITIGLFDGERLEKTFRMTPGYREHRMSTEYFCATGSE